MGPTITETPWRRRHFFPDGHGEDHALHCGDRHTWAAKRFPGAVRSATALSPRRSHGQPPRRDHFRGIGITAGTGAHYRIVANSIVSPAASRRESARQLRRRPGRALARESAHAAWPRWDAVCAYMPLLPAQVRETAAIS